MKIIKKETPIYNRRIILIDDEAKNTNFNWKQFGIDFFSFGSYLKVAYKSINFSENYLHNLTGFGEIDYCNNNFKFPPQHPQKGIVYSCPDFESDFYIPISNFHQHSLKLKESAFIEMCAHLGAKEIVLIEETQDDVKIKIDTNVDNIPSQNGNLSGGFEKEYKSSQTNSGKISFSFPKPSKHNSTLYESKWIETEPTWRTLQKVRLENKVAEYSAELNYTDEMGITINLASKINKMGFNIGGNFNKIKKIERKYKVLFWDNL
jgi:hypothetical protein